MTTPNSPAAQSLDIHADPEFAAQFGSKPGERPLENTSAKWGRSDGEVNVGRTEQMLRLIAGTALVTAAAIAPVNRGMRLAFAGFGAMELITGSRRECPLWKALGVSTVGGFHKVGRAPRERSTLNF